MEKNYEILPEDYPNFDLTFKVIVIGNCGVGKSCTLNVKIKERVIRLQIWDTCGQEQYKSLITNFYRNCSLAIIVYSITEYVLHLHCNY